eukprot:TRINITY_DN3816_c0_g1_i1.p1 TRINITY_DN3816_c0_g1~~TRINITY_DN3816_c0_g1_i1.p1  ORF type:complete len:198 (+),score=26.16 TRINITY_DN3816_c0_g1_i1:58-651(+)
MDYLVILDFEATCEKDTRLNPQEIIEFPSVLIDVRQGTIVDEFHTYVRPVHHVKLTAFCKELTGITQDQVDAGMTFSEAYVNHQLWLQQHGLDPDRPDQRGKSFAIVTCGDWDLKTCLPNQLRTSKKDSHLGYRQWINIKKAYPGRRVRGMVELLEKCGLQLEGRHHSGIDDTRNIARCALHMLKVLRWRPRVNGSL